MFRKCMHKGCKRSAFRGICVNVPAMGWPIMLHKPLPVAVGVALCIEHFNQAKNEPGEFINMVELAVTALCKRERKERPDFARAWITGLQFDSPEWRAVMGQQA